MWSRLLSKENGRKIERKEIPSCLVPHLFFVFPCQLEILVTTLETSEFFQVQKTEVTVLNRHHLFFSLLHVKCGTCLISAKSAVCCICQSIEGANPAGAGDQPDLYGKNKLFRNIIHLEYLDATDPKWGERGSHNIKEVE